MKKWLFRFVLIVFILTGTSCGNTNNDVMETVNPKVTFEPVSNSFYYNQLNEEEVEVFEMILKQCQTFKGGLIELKEPISLQSLLRINFTLYYDEEYRFWPLATLYAYDEQNREVKELTEDRIVSKIYVQLAEATENSALKEFQFDFSEDMVLLNEEEFITVLENTTITEAYYLKRTEQIAELEKEIISEMPKDIREKEAVFYFCNWIKNNMEYDYSVYELCAGLEREEPFSAAMYANAAFETCIIEKKGLCGGFAIIVSDLCNQIGIPSYVVVGTIDVNGETINHGWVAVEIGGKTLYIDPTYVSSMNRMDALSTKDQMEKRRSDGRCYVFTEVFEY